MNCASSVFANATKHYVLGFYFVTMQHMDSPSKKKMFTTHKLIGTLLIGLCGGLMLTACERKPAFDNPVATLHKTTAGEIVQSNLDADIAHWQSKLAGDEAQGLGRYGRLQSSLLLRAQVRMRMDDYLAAQTVAERAIAEHPEAPAAWMLLANSHSAVHRYADAAKAVERAASKLQNAGDPISAAIAARRCNLNRAEGDYTAALRCASDAVTAAPSTATHGEYATLLAEVGKHDAAGAHFAKAWAAYKQPSPVVPAWLALAQSKALQDMGKDKAAAELLTTMQARMPQHLRLTVETAVALESIGKRQAAIDMLTPLLDETGDPDVPNLLAGWLADAGDSTQASAMTEQAKQGFAKHMATLPAAYAAHAVELWAGPGKDLPRALELAKFNAKNSPTVPALGLLLDMASEAEDLPTACEAATKLRRVIPDYALPESAKACENV